MAEKLKGLIDKANAVIGGLLGDFPQGFNTGSIVGIPGYLGDMSYTADMARRWASGEPQIAAQDFPGTTDYIAKAAGYPVPQTLSGQLGMLVGGFMTPGPADLLAAAKFAPAMFLGIKAKTARPEILDLAQSLEAAGRSADEIWQTTAKLGQPWFKGADGKWRFEIPDNQSEMRVDWLDSGRIRPYTLGEVLKHDALYNAHPEIADIPLYPLSKADPWDVDAYYSSADDSIHLRFGEQNKFTAGSVPRTGGNPSLEEIGDARSPSSAFLHEIQHAAQDREAFSRGGTPKDASASAFDEYKKLAGEAEARNVQARMNMSMDERIALPPWLTQDVPTDQQIVRFGDGPAMSVERNGEPIPAAAEFAARREGKPKPYKEFDLGEWAKGTRVSSQDGEPVVMYHGTTHDIEEFKPGTFFTANPQRASGYTETKSGKTDGGTVYPTLINMRNPIKVYGQETSQIPGAGFIVGDELAAKYANNIAAADFAYDENLMRIAKEKGYDGVLVLDDYRTNNPVTAIPFESSQVRFAAGYGQKRRGK